MHRMFMCLLLVAGCECGAKSDEEILAERIDTTSVHLYVAAKIALTKTGDDPRQQEASERLVAAVHAFGDAFGEGASTGEVQTPSAADMLALATSLYALRETGAEVVRSGNEDELEPLLPVLLGGESAGQLPREFNVATDHAVFFLALWVLKVHPRVPVPVPPEVVLYEASRTDVDALAVPGMDVLVRGLRSYTYSMNELCDLAKRDSDALEAGETSIAQLLVPFGGEPISAEDQRYATAGIRALSHGSTAYCYFARDEEDDAHEELELFVSSAEEAGASPEDLGLVRAYLAYKEDRLADARAQLELAKGADWLDDDYREDIDELIEHLDREDTDALDRYFDKAFFVRFCAEIVLREADEAGLFDSLKTTPTWRAVAGFSVAMSQGLSTTQNAASGAVDSARESASGLWNKLMGD